MTQLTLENARDLLSHPALDRPCVESLVFFAAGQAKPKGSHKPFVYRGADGKHRATMAGDSADEKNWRATVTSSARLAMQGAKLAPLECCVDLVLEFYLGPRPKTQFGKGGLKPGAPPRPGKKPDYDKLARSVGDALNGIVYVDDAQVVEATIRKLYTTPAQPYVGVRVTVRPFTGA